MLAALRRLRGAPLWESLTCSDSNVFETIVSSKTDLTIFNCTSTLKGSGCYRVRADTIPAPMAVRPPLWSGARRPHWTGPVSVVPTIEIKSLCAHARARRHGGDAPTPSRVRERISLDTRTNSHLPALRVTSWCRPGEAGGFKISITSCSRSLWAPLCSGLASALRAGDWRPFSTFGRGRLSSGLCHGGFTHGKAQPPAHFTFSRPLEGR